VAIADQYQGFSFYAWSICSLRSGNDITNTHLIRSCSLLLTQQSCTSSATICSIPAFQAPHCRVRWLFHCRRALCSSSLLPNSVVAYGMRLSSFHNIKDAVIQVRPLGCAHKTNARPCSLQLSTFYSHDADVMSFPGGSCTCQSLTDIGFPDPDDGMRCRSATILCLYLSLSLAVYSIIMSKTAATTAFCSCNPTLICRPRYKSGFHPAGQLHHASLKKAFNSA
jgi:hypothetical protein